MSDFLVNRMQLRVRYSETDQMGTFYNSRALEWFECGRTEWIRSAGMSYADMESKGVMLPLVEAHVRYHGRAKYDDLLEVETSAAMNGKARVRFEMKIFHSPAGPPVASGWTEHAIVSTEGRVIRPPEWFMKIFETPLDVDDRGAYQE